MARELLEQAISRQDLGQAITVLNQLIGQVAKDMQTVQQTLASNEDLIRRVGRAVKRGVLTTEEFARTLIDDRKYKSMIHAVQQTLSQEGKKGQ